MEYNQFLQTIKERVEKAFGEEYLVELNHIIKNNSIELDGIVIFKEGEKISPNIYLNSYFYKADEEKGIGDAVSDIIDIYKETMGKDGGEELEIPFEFEEMKDNIIYRLVNFKRNEKILKDIPYIRFLDLAIIFTCLVKQSKDGIGTLRLNNLLIDGWGVNKKKLLQLAHENTQRIFPATIRTMNEVICDILTEGKLFEGKEKQSQEEKMDDRTVSILSQMNQEKINSLYVLSNSDGINGSGALLYQDVIKDFANQIESDVYILPSSIHEVILVPYQASISKKTLSQLVWDVNRTQVPLEEILSDEVYLYQRKNNSFEV
jgi:hypothetical protein